MSTLSKALTGASPGGLGVLLPVLLVVIALGGGTLVLLRRRRAV